MVMNYMIICTVTLKFSAKLLSWYLTGKIRVLEDSIVSLFAYQVILLPCASMKTLLLMTGFK